MTELSTSRIPLHHTEAYDLVRNAVSEARRATHDPELRALLSQAFLPGLSMLTVLAEELVDGSRGDETPRP